ncbi:MAG TPA: hypothetical protein VMU32_13055 [Solirubrobacteraceae bacterium]|nr:hypothetical protein [Solirubrobacteraceae bacterium]
MPGQPSIAVQASPPGYSSTGARGAGLPALLRHLDVLIVVIAAPLAIVLGAPALGCLLGAVAWVLQTVLAKTDKRLIRRASEPRTQLGLNIAEAFGRIWLLAGAIILAAVVGGRSDGLACALIVFAAYTVAFVIRVLSGPPARPAGASARGALR